MTRYVDEPIVVTGLGVVSTVGDTVGAFHQALVAGESGVSRWPDADERPYSKLGGILTDFDLVEHFERVGGSYPNELRERAKKLLRSTPLPAHLVAAAALQAFQGSGLEGHVNPERFAHVLSGHNFNANYFLANARTYYEEDPDYIEPLYGVLALDTDVLSVTSELLEVKGPSFTVGGACASGNLGLLSGFDLLRLGRADVVLVTGGALDVDPVALQGWAMIDAISYESFNDEPARASRPFDARREGFVPGHGSAALVLETLTHAKARSAAVHAELKSAVSTSDASRLTKPNLEGQMRAMALALDAARVNPEQVDYINAHATSTPLGDAVEVAAVKRVLGHHAYAIPVNSTKSMIGHNLSAASVVEAVATITQMKHSVVHPTINQEEQDPELDLDFVPNEARDQHIAVAVSNSFGFGGLNSCVVFGSV